MFEASASTRQALHRVTEQWLGVEDGGAADAGTSSKKLTGNVGEGTVPPKSLVIGDLTLPMQPGSEPSQIMGADHMRALASALPPMKRYVPWQLAYSSKTHGISLGTLFRRSAGHVSTFLVVRDTAGGGFGCMDGWQCKPFCPSPTLMAGYIFGCYSEDGWKVMPRFYGTGETFVFQLEVGLLPPGLSDKLDDVDELVELICSSINHASTRPPCDHSLTGSCTLGAPWRK